MWRRNVIIVYNARDNEPVVRNSIQPFYNKVEVVEDGALAAEGACVRLDPTRRDFLGNENNSSGGAQGQERDRVEL